jgi:hypothetical protein
VAWSYRPGAPLLQARCAAPRRRLDGRNCAPRGDAAPRPLDPPAVYHGVRQRWRRATRCWRCGPGGQRARPAPVAGEVVEGVRPPRRLIATLDGRCAWRRSRRRAQAEHLGRVAGLLTSAPGLGWSPPPGCSSAPATYRLAAGPAPPPPTPGGPEPRESGRTVRGRPAIGHAGNAASALFVHGDPQRRAAKTRRSAFYQRLRAPASRWKVARCAPPASCSTSLGGSSQAATLRPDPNNHNNPPPRRPARSPGGRRLTALRICAG